MPEQRTHLRIREGNFTYLLAVGRDVSIEDRSSGALESIAGGTAVRAAWYSSGDERIPVYRLGLLLRYDAGQWARAVLLSDEEGRFGLAAGDIDLLAETGIPPVQPFNPPGSRIAGGSPIVGVCPTTQPEHLVLDAAILHACARRADRG